MILPWELEEHLLNSLPQQYPDLPSHAIDFKPLIPIHDPSKHNLATAALPSLRDTTTGSGNLRYWVITNENIWAGQHRVLDEMAEILWSMFHWFNQIVSETILRPRSQPRSGPISADHPESVWHLARSCRRRIVLPQVVDDQNTCDIVYPPREALLFRQWAFRSPVIVGWERGETQINSSKHTLFNALAVQYPFPDNLFWEDGDEGEWSEEGVPPWRDSLTDDGLRNTPAENFYNPVTASNETDVQLRPSSHYHPSGTCFFPSGLYPMEEVKLAFP